MNENIDIRMSNYITILSNPEMRKKFTDEAIRAMEESVVIYGSTTAVKYVNNYHSEREKNKREEELASDKHEKLDVSSLFR